MIYFYADKNMTNESYFKTSLSFRDSSLSIFKIFKP